MPRFLRSSDTVYYVQTRKYSDGSGDAVSQINCKDSLVRSAKDSCAKAIKKRTARGGNCKKRDTSVVKTSAMNPLI